MSNLKEIQKEDKTILKEGRRTYATVSFNPNPDYKWMLWMKGGWALSGFSSKEAAIKRANELNNGFKEVLSSITLKHSIGVSSKTHRN